MKRAVLYILSLSLLVLMSPLSASDQGGTESPFSFGAGARELALGGAGLAECNGDMAPFWNASRLARAGQYSLSAFHSNLYESDVAYQYLGLAVPTMDFGSFGLGIFRLGIKGIRKRDEGDLYLGDIDDNRLAVNLAYARTISDYDFGLVIMMEHHSLDDYSATSSPGFNLSAGRRFELNNGRFRYISAAVNFRNLIKPHMNLVEENIGYPGALDLGLTSGIMPNPRWNQTLNLSLRLTKVENLDPDLSAGIEYDIEKLLWIRGGIHDRKLSMGAGIKIKSVAFDYALVDRDLGSLHMFTLTTSFGMPIKEKRQERLRRREAEFDDLMRDRLMSLNREKVSQMTAEGRQLLEEGKLVEAAGAFDRALFLARASSLDSTAIIDLAQETQSRLREVSRTERYQQFLDSAGVKLTNGDFLAARYFASLALTEKPDAPEAKAVWNRADETIRQLESREETIKNQLWAADSLLSYGQIDQALTLLSALEEYAPGDINVGKARRKAVFERWRTMASNAYSTTQFDLALSALDSALSLFPGHEWCLDLKKRIQRESTLTEQKTAPAPMASIAEPLSPELEKEVAAAYTTGRDLFTRGELPDAIKFWEKVERMAPDYLSVRSYLVNAYRFVGIDLYSRSLYDQAVEVWKKAVRLEPDNEEINGYIRRTETEIRKLQELSYEHGK